MDKIINWFMMLIIFVFDPLAIAMVVAANMAFAKIKPEEDVKEYFVYHNEDTVTEEEVMEVLEEEVECSVPEGMEFDVSYPIKEEIQEDEVIEKEVIKEEPIPKPPINTYKSSWGSPGGNRSKKS